MFKVGDKVEVIGETHGWGRVTRGDIGTIVHKDAEIYSVDFEAQKGWNGWQSCFVKHSPHPYLINISGDDCLLDEKTFKEIEQLLLDKGFL